MSYVKSTKPFKIKKMKKIKKRNTNLLISKNYVDVVISLRCGFSAHAAHETKISSN